MKLRLYSDLHLDGRPAPGAAPQPGQPPFQPFVLPMAGPDDVLILAGDVCRFTSSVRREARTRIRH